MTRDSLHSPGTWKQTKILEVLPKIKPRNPNVQLRNQPTVLFCLLLELEIKPFTSTFNHKTTAPNVVIFFPPLKQQSTGQVPRGSGEDGPDIAFPNRYWNTICWSGGLILLTSPPKSPFPLKQYPQLRILLKHYPCLGKKNRTKTPKNFFSRLQEEGMQ